MKKFTLNTNGKGLWSNQVKKVTITNLSIDNVMEDGREGYFGEVVLDFDTKTWNVKEDGLIYTDDLFLKELRTYLKNNFKLSIKAVNDIDYSEQGMQGDDFVSLDCGSFFIKEYFEKIFKPKNKG